MKHLVLLSDNYPNSNGEFFLDDEINIISSKFEKITVLCTSKKTESHRQVPENVDIIELTQIRFFNRILLIFKGLFFLPLWKELLSLKKSYALRANFLIFKILVEDFVRSSIVIKVLYKHQLTDPSKHILYSYWHDYKALTIARIRKKTGCTAIARCHRWDVYFYANTPPYLPYKKYLLNELSLTCSISDDGINYMRQIHNFQKQNKLVLSRLGKINNRISHPFVSASNVITICSCSTLTSVKRVELIIYFIKSLSAYVKIKWVHFGDGILKEKLLKLAEESLISVDYNFMGILPNEEILNFYHVNFVDLFINFSASEGIPVSIMEAQSAGIPVLATNVGGTSEIVNDENGFLVEKNFKLEDVVSIIQNYLSSTYEEKQQKRNSSYENWKQNYNAETNYNEFVKLLTINHSPLTTNQHNETNSHSRCSP